MLKLLVVIAAVAVMLLWSQAQQNKRRRLKERFVDEVARSSGLETLTAYDPAFDLERFLGRARTVMARLNEAWTKGDLGPVRPLVSDGVFVRFSTQLQLLRAAGKRNVMADWKITRAELVAAQSGERWDALHVVLGASAVDLEVPAELPEAEVQQRLASAAPGEYEEVWSFLRRRGAKTRADSLEGKCPACGAPLPLSEVVRCQYCRALTNSGEHDWVLAEITQPEELDPRAADAEVPGLEAIRARDPQVSRQELEDRASVVFWKWIDARQRGDRKRLERFCLKPGAPDAEPARMRDVAVGSCDAVQAVPDAGDGLDRVKLEVRWSGVIGDGGDGAGPIGYRHRLVLARASNARSAGGLSTLDCPTCGAPLAGSDDPTCRSCGTRLGCGQAEWSLESLHLLG